MLILVRTCVFRALLRKREILMVDSLAFAVYCCKWNVVDMRYEYQVKS